MRLSTLLLLPLLAIVLPSTHAITCAIGKLLPDANGQIDILASTVPSWSCPTQVTQCATTIMRQAFNLAEPRYVVLTCQPTDETCGLQTIISPDHWAEVRCCIGNNCNKQGLNNIDWSDRRGNNPTIPSTSTSIPTISSNPTIQPAPTQAPNTRIRCREGTTIPASNGQIGPDTSSWQSSTCQEGQNFCVTFFQRTDDQKFIMANCADRCTPSVFVTTKTQWIETTCCTGDNCNNDINKLSTHDWGIRSTNVTGPPATAAPASGTSSPTSLPGPFSAASTFPCSVVLIFPLVFVVFSML